LRRDWQKPAEQWLDHRLPYVGITSAGAGLALADLSPTAGGVGAGVFLLAAASGIAARAALVAAILVAIGVAVGAARIETVEAPAVALESGEEIAGLAHLLTAPRAGAIGWSAEIRMASGEAAGVRLWARLPAQPQIGDGDAPGAELRLTGTFDEPEPAASGFDFAAYLRSQRIAGELVVEDMRLTGRRRGGIAGVVDGVRSRSDRALGNGLGPTAAALVRGMVLGADEAIPVGVRDDFRDAGLAHTLAVSGQNVVLLCALVVPLLAAGGVGHGARVPVLLGLIALYVPLTGAGASIQRAGVMGAAALAATALARPASRVYALGLAVCVTLLLNPRAWADPAWQLSFAAVLGILLWTPRIARRLAALPRPLAEGIALTVAASLATGPLLAHHFGTVSTAGLVANVVALPLIAPIMWLGMLRAAVGQAEPLGGPLGELASLANGLLGILLAPLLEVLQDLAARFADAPGGQADLALEGPVEVGLAYALLMVLLLAARRAARRFDPWGMTAVAYVRRLPRVRRFALAIGVAVAIALVLARGLAPVGPPARLTVTFLDVGQGDATLVQHPDGSSVLFDGGPPEGGVARLLRRAGVRRLSALVMTHASRDHHGGLAEVVERIPIGVLIDGGDGTHDRAFRAVVARAAARGARIVDGIAPLALRVGALRLAIKSPGPRSAGPPPEDPNPRAVVAVVSCDGFDLLLSGDAESEALLPLALPDVDALKVAHHGSADPGLPDLLERVAPEIASIPVGRNSYGHPAPSTLTALRRADVMTWRNDRNGTVRVTVASGATSVEAERGGPVSGAP
jgi:competence protein ComEC